MHDGAVVATVPLGEHHPLTGHRNELADHFHRLLGTSTERCKRDRALDALNAWDRDTSTPENANDNAAR
ncbi:hypothetical protein ACIBCM_06675 [Streptomyces sp. NPDC051018]|uniref:hypothetical protein n=1 Tax=Streptomyces sp. NPDC051018 TaxID=3365639 RepID=UPI0037B896F0